MKQYIALVVLAMSCVAVSAQGSRDTNCTEIFFLAGRHDNSCVDFFMCMDSSRIDFTCDPGDIFDEERTHCRRGNAETCEFLPIPISADACDGVFKAIRSHPDPYLCGRFYMCLNENIVQFRCQDGYIFNEYAERCIPGDLETCRETPTTPYDASLSYAIQL